MTGPEALLAAISAGHVDEHRRIKIGPLFFAEDGTARDLYRDAFREFGLEFPKAILPVRLMINWENMGDAFVDEMSSWIVENCSGHWVLWVKSLYFEHLSDAMLVKLRFSQEA